MQGLLRATTALMLSIIFVCAPAMCFANTINLHQEPKDQSKVIGIVDLSKGVIPIYVPKNSQWTKIADPRNGNTGWVKNDELKSSNGKIITFSQEFSENDNGQTIQMMQTSGQVLTPAQKKKIEAIVKEQEQTTKETLIKAQKSVAEMMDGLKKIYQQQLEIIQQSGFPVLIPATSQQQDNSGPQQMMRHRGMNQMHGQQQSYPQQGMQQMQGQQSPGMMGPPPHNQGGMQQGGQPSQRFSPQQTNQMQQPGNGKASGTY